MNSKNTKIGSRERVMYLDLLKAVSIIGVIFIHVSAVNWYTDKLYTPEWIIHTIYNGLVQFSVPVFVMVSGALFLARDIPVKTIYKKYMPRLIIAYLFWSTVYALIKFCPVRNVNTFICEIIKGHYHLWFVPMIAVQYMLVPIYKRIVKNRRLAEYFIIISLALFSVIPTIIGQIAICSKDYGEALQALYSKANLDVLFGYSLFFILGYILNTAELSRKAERIIYIIGAIGFISTPLLIILNSRATGAASTFYGGNFRPNVIACAVSIFVFTKNHSGYLKSGTAFARVITKLSKYSFGVYLVHLVFLELLRYTYKITPETFGAALGVPLMVIIVYAASTLVTAIISKIPFINKYIV